MSIWNLCRAWNTTALLCACHRDMEAGGGGKELVPDKGDLEEDDVNTQQGGVAPRVSGRFFKAVVQAVLLLGLDTWVVTPFTGKALGRFQTQVMRRLTGRLPRKPPDGNCTYISAGTAREEAGLLTMEEYIRRHQNAVAHYIATRSLLDMCEGSERAQGARLGMRWWEQAGLNLAGER